MPQVVSACFLAVKSYVHNMTGHYIILYNIRWSTPTSTCCRWRPPSMAVAAVAAAAAAAAGCFACTGGFRGSCARRTDSTWYAGYVIILIRRVFYVIILYHIIYIMVFYDTAVLRDRRTRLTWKSWYHILLYRIVLYHIIFFYTILYYLVLPCILLHAMSYSI